MTARNLRPFFYCTMIECLTNPQQFKRLETWYDFDALNNSITQGKGNDFGAMGEIWVNDYFADKNNLKRYSCKDFDFKIDGYKTEVKSKHTNFLPPKSDWLFSVAKSSLHQLCDVYFFVSILKDLSKGYIVGYLTRAEFWAKSFDCKKGEKDIHGWTFKEDCKSVYVSDLNQFKHPPKKPVQLCLQF